MNQNIKQALIFVSRIVAMSVAGMYFLGFLWFLGQQDPIINLLNIFIVVATMLAASVPRAYWKSEERKAYAVRLVIRYSGIAAIFGQILFSLYRLYRFDKNLYEVIGGLEIVFLASLFVIIFESTEAR